MPVPRRKGAATCTDGDWVALPYFFASFPDDSAPRTGKGPSHGSRRGADSRSVTPAQALSDAEQERVACIRSGDEAAYAALFTELFTPLCEFTATYVGGVAVAEEIVQDVFLDIWTRRADWNPGGGLRAYFFRAVRNRAMNAVKHRRVVERVTADDAVEWMSEPLPLADAGVPETELIEALRPVIAAFQPMRRRAVLLRWRYGLSYAEIADALGTSVGAVTMHIARAREVVRPIVERFIAT